MRRRERRPRRPISRNAQGQQHAVIAQSRGAIGAWLKRAL
jgi:hypothetical protein